MGFQKIEVNFLQFRSTTSNVKVATRGESKDIGQVKASTPEISMFSDAVMTILTNKNNPVVECRFADVFPTKFKWIRLFTKSNRC